MGGRRIDRISENIKRELSEIFRALKDPRISKLLSIVKVDVSGDLSFAKVYISAIEGEKATKESAKALQSAAGFIRRELAARLKIRHTPQLMFIADDSILHGAQISKIISDIAQQKEVKDSHEDRYQ